MGILKSHPGERAARRKRLAGGGMVPLRYRYEFEGDGRVKASASGEDAELLFDARAETSSCTGHASVSALGPVRRSCEEWNATHPGLLAPCPK